MTQVFTLVKILKNKCLSPRSRKANITWILRSYIWRGLSPDKDYPFQTEWKTKSDTLSMMTEAPVNSSFPQEFDIEVALSHSILMFCLFWKHNNFNIFCGYFSSKQKVVLKQMMKV